MPGVIMVIEQIEDLLSRRSRTLPARNRLRRAIEHQTLHLVDELYTRTVLHREDPRDVLQELRDRRREHGGRLRGDREEDGDEGDRETHGVEERGKCDADALAEVELDPDRDDKLEVDACTGAHAGRNVHDDREEQRRHDFGDKSKERERGDECCARIASTGRFVVVEEHRLLHRVERGEVEESDEGHRGRALCNDTDAVLRSCRTIGEAKEEYEETDSEDGRLNPSGPEQVGLSPRIAERPVEHHRKCNVHRRALRPVFE